jgi:hypothetical protein
MIQCLQMSIITLCGKVLVFTAWTLLVSTLKSCKHCIGSFISLGKINGFGAGKWVSFFCNYLFFMYIAHHGSDDNV